MPNHFHVKAAAFNAVLLISWLAGLANRDSPKSLPAGLFKYGLTTKLLKPFTNWQTPTTDQKTAIRNLEKVVLGNIYLSQIKPTGMYTAYLAFLQNLKAHNESRTATDWNNAEHMQ